MNAPRPFDYTESPDHPGWMTWSLIDDTRFNGLFGPFLLKVEAGIARVRMTPGHQHSNLSNAVHGGALLGFVDMALFAAARGFGVIEAGTAVTLDLSTQFIGRGVIGQPLEAQVELLRETGQLLFLRGLVVQGDGDGDGEGDGEGEGNQRIASFSGTIRKASAR